MNTCSRPSLDSKELKSALSRRPVWSPDDRALPHEARLRKVASLAEFFAPTPFQLKFGMSLHSLLQDREEAAALESFCEERVEICPDFVPGQRTYLARLPVPPAYRSPAREAHLLAMPGMGKTSVTRRVLDLAECKVNRDGQHPRIEWLYLHLNAADLDQFCTDLLKSLSDAAGDPIIRRVFLAHNAKKDSRPMTIVELAKVHSLGCLIVDDCQALYTVDNGDVPKIRALLKRLQEEAGVPVVMVGTLAAADASNKNPGAQMAFGGPASDVWGRMEFDQSWQEFIEALWPFQWTRSEAPLSEEISLRLYDRSQGLIDLAIQLYGRVQTEIIRLGKRDTEAGKLNGFVDEIITPEFVDAVAEWCFKPSHPIIDALRSRDFAKLAAFPDFKPLPSEATRLEAERMAMEACTSSQEEQSTAASDIRLNAEDTPCDATEEQLKEYAARVQKEADVLIEAARLTMRAAELTTEQQDKILSDLAEDFDNKIYSSPRQFLAGIDRQIRIIESRRKKAEKRGRRVATEEDLERILEPGKDVISAIRGAEMGMAALLARP